MPAGLTSCGAMRRSRYDVALDLQGLMKSAVLARASGASRVVGFSIWHLREKAARPFYSETDDAAGARPAHVITRISGCFAALGVDDVAGRSFRSPRRRRRALERCPDARSAGRPFALINPGAAWPNKRWPPDASARSRHSCGTCAAAVGRAVGTGGSARSRDAVVAASGGAARARRRRASPICWRSSRAAALMVSGDTGPLHLAAAVGTPVVGSSARPIRSATGPGRRTTCGLAATRASVITSGAVTARRGAWTTSGRRGDGGDSAAPRRASSASAGRQ